MKPLEYKLGEHGWEETEKPSSNHEPPPREGITINAHKRGIWETITRPFSKKRTTYKIDSKDITIIAPEKEGFLSRLSRLVVGEPPPPIDIGIPPADGWEKEVPTGNKLFDNIFRNGMADDKEFQIIDSNGSKTGLKEKLFPEHAPAPTTSVSPARSSGSWFSGGGYTTPITEEIVENLAQASKNMGKVTKGVGLFIGASAVLGAFIGTKGHNKSHVAELNVQRQISGLGFPDQEQAVSASI